MSEFIKIKEGLDINLAGKPQKKLAEPEQPETFAVKPPDFYGIGRIKVIVKEGDNVKAGTPVFFDKKNEQIQFTAPVSGEVVEIKQGAKRKTLEIRILADKEIEYEDFGAVSISDISKLDREKVVERMVKSGVWPNVIQRPYAVFADPQETPKAIFISAFDSHPLAPDYNYVFKGEEKNFQAGIDVLRKLTSGAVHLNINADAEVSHLFAHTKGVELNKFSGPHPAGNVGVQIHHIAPIANDDLIWTVSPYGVVQIGKLFLEGKYDASKVIAVAGSEVQEPQYVKTISGARVSKFLENNLKQDHVRVVSGNVLTGTNIGKDGYLGFYDNMISVIPEGDHHEFLGWIKPSVKKHSFHRAFGLLSFLAPNQEFVVDSNMHGEERAFVQTGAFEKVVPMDIYPMHLLKAILAEDYDDMLALGIKEVSEEDFALCEYIDVSKHKVQAILRHGLELMRQV